MLNKLKSLLRGLWANDNVRRVVHTFLQAFIAVFVVGLTNVLNAFQNNGLAAGKAALLALVGAAIAAALSAVKNAVVARREA